MGRVIRGRRWELLLILTAFLVVAVATWSVLQLLGVPSTGLGQLVYVVAGVPAGLVALVGIDEWRYVRGER